MVDMQSDSEAENGELSKKDAALELVGVTKNPETSEYSYNTSVNSEGESTGKITLTPQEADTLADKVIALDERSKSTIGRSFEQLVPAAENDDGKVTPPAELLKLAELEWGAVAVFDGTQSVHHQRVKDSLPEAGNEEELNQYHSANQTLNKAAKTAAEVIVAGAIMGQIPDNPEDSAKMHLALPLLSAGKCKQGIFDALLADEKTIARNTLECINLNHQDGFSVGVARNGQGVFGVGIEGRW